MIVRLWRGWTLPADADAYQAFLEAEIDHGFLDLEGVVGAEVLRSERGAETAFVTLLRFRDPAALRAFAGPDLEVAVVPERARRLLSRFDERVTHDRVAASR